MGICWMMCMGDCNGGWSKEHIISQSLFESNEVTISGVDWTGNEIKKIPIAGAVAKILCREHNSQLSPLDEEIKKVKYAFINYHGDATDFLTGKSPDCKSVYEVDGNKFERWLLKTTINHLFYSPVLYAGFSLTRDLVEIVCGKTEFDYKQKCGLYMVDPSIHQNFLQNTANISISPVLLPSGNEKFLIGTLVSIFGHGFFLKVAQTENCSFQFRGVNLISEKNFHPQEMGIIQNGKFNNRIRLSFNFRDFSQSK